MTRLCRFLVSRQCSFYLCVCVLDFSGTWDSTCKTEDTEGSEVRAQNGLRSVLPGVRWRLGGAGPCRHWASSGAPRPGVQFPRRCLLLRAGGLAGRLLRVRLCLPLTSASVCPSGGFLRVLTTLPAAEFLSWSRHLLAWAGPGQSSAVWVPPRSRGAGSLRLAVGALGPGASCRAGVSRGASPALCGPVPLALLPRGEGPARASRPSPSRGPHPGRGPSSPLPSLPQAAERWWRGTRGRAQASVLSLQTHHTLANGVG